MFRHPAFVAFLLAMPATAHAQSCQCIDKGDIKARTAEAQAAIQAYEDEIQVMTEQMQRTQSPLPYTGERRLVLQERVQKAIRTNTGRIPTTPTMGDNPGGIDNLCRTKISMHPSATACMRESVTRHEEYHRQECLKTRSVGKIATSVTTGKDRFERDGWQLVQYAGEEIGAYHAEVMFLSQELARLESACKEPKREVRDYTAQRRSSNPPAQKPADTVKEGVDQVRKLLGF